MVAKTVLTFEFTKEEEKAFSIIENIIESYCKMFSCDNCPHSGGCPAIHLQSIKKTFKLYTEEG